MPSSTLRSPAHQLQQNGCDLLKCLAGLRQLSRLDDAAHDALQTARDLLASLPLASEQYGLARNRLVNVARYLRLQEVGAARYELRLLAAGLAGALGA